MIKRILAILLLFPAICFSAPAVTGVTGTTSFVIIGSGFGSKATVDPLVFETFDTNDSGRQDGDSILSKECSLFGTWASDTTDATPKYEADNNRTGSTLSSYHHMIAADTANNHAPMTIDFAESHQTTVLISFWMRYVVDAVCVEGQSCNNKIYRMHDNSGSTENDDYHTSLQVGSRTPVPEDGIMAIYLFEGNGADWESDDTTLNFDYPEYGTWSQHIIMLKASDDNTANGSAIIWIDGEKLEDTSAMETWDTADSWQAMTFGWYTNAFASGTIDLQFDDIYIDNSWQSVWIGNASTWATCTHREIQIPTEWATGEITVSVNQGSFDDGTAYLYVVDANGVPNADGYEITLGEEAEPAQVSIGCSIGGSFQ